MSFIVSSDFLDLEVITSRTEDANYPDDNVGDQWHLKRRFRAADVNVNDWLMKFDLGANRTIEAVVLDDVNFDTVQIHMAAADGGFPWVHNSGNLTVSLDPVVNRYKIIYIPTAAVTQQWVAIFIPAGTAAVGSYTTKWQIGRVGIMDSVTTIMKKTYSRTSEKAYKDISLPSEGSERVDLGEQRWIGTVGFENIKERIGTGVFDESNMWALNNMEQSDPLIFYENDLTGAGAPLDTSKVYFCLRDEGYEGTLIHRGIAQGNMVRFKELT